MGFQINRQRVDARPERRSLRGCRQRYGRPLAAMRTANGEPPMPSHERLNGRKLDLVIFADQFTLGARSKVGARWANQQRGLQDLCQKRASQNSAGKTVFFEALVLAAQEAPDRPVTNRDPPFAKLPCQTAQGDIRIPRNAHKQPGPVLSRYAKRPMPAH